MMLVTLLTSMIGSCGVSTEQVPSDTSELMKISLLFNTFRLLM